ncbi:MAG: ABC transporter ATP-binding protein [Maritimibacter sp.]|nr:ABC transporter ATP-binding protein [Maritimibacter sp.]
MTEPVLSVTGLTKAFGGLTATDGVSLTLRPGEIHALIGPNGAGKSTLIRQIAGDLAPDAGRVEIAGRDVTALDTVARARRGLARTFQVSSLAMEMTVLQNVVLGALGRQGRVFRLWRNVLRDEALVARARAALERVWLEDFAATRVADLSHGQRRAVEIAVALVLGPRAFLMDEPFAGMGMDGARQLVEVLDGLRTEAPVLLVEHDMDVVFALADRISVLVSGRLIATGTADEIRADARVRAAYLGEDAPS